MNPTTKENLANPTVTNAFCQFQADGVSFFSQEVLKLRTIYAPLCGIDATSVKSAITPYLSGDIKIDKFRYLTKPASREDLRQDVRNFFLHVEGEGVFSLSKETAPDSARVEVGQIWHKLVRQHPAIGVEMTAVNFVPVSGEDLELMRVTIRNVADKNIRFTPTAAIPIFGRGLANKHDHEHVTALLQRTHQHSQGVVVEPTMAFNEEGHKPIQVAYYVLGTSGTGENPAGTFPTADAFYGEGGNIDSPEAVVANWAPRLLEAEDLHGKEAVGALRFKMEHLAPGEIREYLIAIGIASTLPKAEAAFQRFAPIEKFDQALAENIKFWEKKTGSIQFTAADPQFNAWLRWVTLQPILRRIFGCSFLPDHDYGKGGKGWRDIWQDLLSLILIEPETIRATLVNNFAGVRIDGSNATIIGSAPGEFIADRNAITRVWMDHGVWPFLTTLLYINQTGDYDILLNPVTYFRDPQLSRTFEKDRSWTPAYGNKLKTKKGKVYRGTILEHILVQHLVQFFNVGEHNIIRLESADWNDGLDMAFDRGESVTFAAFYGGNLIKIADLLETFAAKKRVKKIKLAKELVVLLDGLKKPPSYNNAAYKKKLLFGKYFKAVQPEVSGQQVQVDVKALAADLRKKGNWIFEWIRKKEKVSGQEGSERYFWLNGYYDNKGKRVEGKKKDKLWMTLTGQVFPIMSGLTTLEETKKITASVDRYLKDKRLGGYHLNTDFELRHYLDFGRAFGFVYGTKENGAFFSHMNVMYAYALYSRGLAREGYKVLQSIYKMSRDTKRSKIYPGVPEYFDAQGRGMYHYLTGSASWLILTQLTQVFGVRGEEGDLVIAPKLVREEFDSEGKASVACQFAGGRLTVEFYNPAGLDHAEYRIKEVLANGRAVIFKSLSPQQIKIPRPSLGKSSNIHFKVILSA